MASTTSKPVLRDAHAHVLPLSSAKFLSLRASTALYQKPHPLLSFSYSSSRDLVFDDSALRYYVHPPLDADLAFHYESWIKRPEVRPRLDGLLQACLRKEAKAERKRADLITWRGILTKIFTIPYEQREGWQLNVMLVNGTLYLEEHLSTEQLRAKSNLEPKHRLLSYFGYSFESFCTRSTPDESPTPDGWGGDVDTNVQWCSVVKTKLNDLRIIIGGEVDCVRDHYNSTTDTFIELKTSQDLRPNHKGDKKKFEQKLLKFFIQSYLLGIPEVIVGFRSDDGHLRNVVPFKTEDIPDIVQRNTKLWDHQVCQSWADEALHFLYDSMSSWTNDENEVWRLIFEPNFGLRLRKLSDPEVDEVSNGEDRVGFLPTAYWRAIKKLS